MARQGTVKYRSRLQENWVAAKYNGKVSESSGASITDAGDVRTSDQLIECKTTGNPTKPAQSISLRLADFEKIADEAWAEGRLPMMALQIHNPDSVLADNEGNINFAVRLIYDDIIR